VSDNLANEQRAVGFGHSMRHAAPLDVGGRTQGFGSNGRPGTAALTEAARKGLAAWTNSSAWIPEGREGE
jgi:hypothetical protein